VLSSRHFAISFLTESNEETAAAENKFCPRCNFSASKRHSTTKKRGPPRSYPNWFTEKILDFYRNTKAPLLLLQLTTNFVAANLLLPRLRKFDARARNTSVTKERVIIRIMGIYEQHQRRHERLKKAREERQQEIAKGRWTVVAVGRFNLGRLIMVR